MRKEGLENVTIRCILNEGSTYKNINYNSLTFRVTLIKVSVSVYV